ncbi:MAG: tetratricopeptide repeat protein [Bacteroidota bacterium]
MRIYSLLLFFVLLFSIATAQNIDSLKIELKNAKHDTTRCNLLNLLVEVEPDENVWPEYNLKLKELSQRNLKIYNANHPLHKFFLKHYAVSISNDGYFELSNNENEKAIKLLLESLKIQEKINDKLGISTTLSNLGSAYQNIGKSDEALEMYKKSLKLSEEIDYKEGIAIAINNLGLLYSSTGEIDKAIDYFIKSLIMDVELKNKNGEAVSLNNIGYMYQVQGNSAKALYYYNKSLAIRKEQNDIVGLAILYNNIGLIYNNMGDIPKALEFLNQSLKFEEQLKNKKGIASTQGNIGKLYKQLKDNSKALEYFKKSLAINTEINNLEGLSISYGNIGDAYFDNGDTEKALQCFTKALKLNQEINDKSGIATSLNDIGNVYKTKANYAIALDYFLKSLKMKEEINDKEGMSVSLNCISEVMLAQNKINEALSYATRSISIAKDIGYPEDIKKASKILSIIYAKKGDYKNAYQMQVLFKQMDDSIHNETNRKISMQQSFQYEYDKKAAADSVKVAEQKKVFDAEMKQGKTQRTALFAGIGLIALFSIFMYNRFRVTNKQKAIIELQKIEVDKQRELADSRREIAEAHKQIIQAKQKEILDSIHYAKRIQQAMLTSEEYINKNFNAEYFIFYQPKDIVSGDFYWAASHNKKFYIATGDCTGHGVPGAFMSLLNINFLNENVIERNIIEPAQILNEQRRSIIKSLNPKGTENSKDGMDCILCAFDLNNSSLQFAAANNPLWLVRDNKLSIFKADKMPVGKYEEDSKDFTPQNIDIKKGDVIYTFTDGYADQFGGEAGKKFKYKRLEKWVIENHQLPMNKQREALATLINEWKGANEQVDDILMIGVKI